MYHSRILKIADDGRLVLNIKALEQLGLLEAARKGVVLNDWDLALINRYEPDFIVKVGSDPRKRHVVASEYGVSLRQVTEMRRRRKRNLWPFNIGIKLLDVA